MEHLLIKTAVKKGRVVLGALEVAVTHQPDEYQHSRRKQDVSSVMSARILSGKHLLRAYFRYDCPIYRALRKDFILKTGYKPRYLLEALLDAQGLGKAEAALGRSGGSLAATNAR